MRKAPPPLWRCQTCGRAFANRNQSHACGRYSLAHHFRAKPRCAHRAIADHLHAFRITESNDIDEVFRGWLAEAYEVGEQRHLRRAKLAPMSLTAEDFRRIALGLKDAVESAHMGHPDFRVNGRIFATLHADMAWGMVSLTPEQQQTFLEEHPRVFKPENGAWGRQGCTAVRLDAIDEEALGEALTLAWRNWVRAPSKTRSRKRARG